MLLTLLSSSIPIYGVIGLIRRCHILGEIKRVVNVRHIVDIPNCEAIRDEAVSGREIPNSEAVNTYTIYKPTHQSIQNIKVLHTTPRLQVPFYYSFHDSRVRKLTAITQEKEVLDEFVHAVPDINNSNIYFMESDYYKHRYKTETNSYDNVADYLKTTFNRDLPTTDEIKVEIASGNTITDMYVAKIKDTIYISENITELELKIAKEKTPFAISSLVLGNILMLIGLW